MIINISHLCKINTVNDFDFVHFSRTAYYNVDHGAYFFYFKAVFREKFRESSKSQVRSLFLIIQVSFFTVTKPVILGANQVPL